jgi:hypothetical protein
VGSEYQLEHLSSFKREREVSFLLKALAVSTYETKDAIANWDLLCY